MRILVTGGSGYLGTHVCRFFGAENYSRRSYHDVLDVRDAERVADYDVVIHLAGHLDKHPDGADLCFRVNSEGTLNLIRNMRPGSVFILASTKDVYGANAERHPEVDETCPTDYRGQSAFEWSKLVAERYVEYFAKRQDVRACIFRLSSVYARPSSGNENGFVTHYVESVKNGWPIRLPANEDPIRDLLAVDDFSRACQAFVDSSQPFGLYNLGGGRENAVSLREIIGRVGRMIELQPVIEEDASMPLPVPLNYISDLTRISHELQWRPQVGVDEGLRGLL
jgi:nucleoside-diphosphate-sugar epimerase